MTVQASQIVIVTKLNVAAPVGHCVLWLPALAMTELEVYLYD
jgi:hypothetical protein